MRQTLGFSLVALAVLGLACGGIQAPIRHGGGALTLYVLTDWGIDESSDEGLVKQRTQLGTWMDNDLVKLATKAGYDVKKIEKREEFVDADDTFLLTVKVVKYNPGSAAVRHFVGVGGAGRAVLDTQTELIGKGGKSESVDTHKSECPKRWGDCARACNEMALKKISNHLALTYPLPE